MVSGVWLGVASLGIGRFGLVLLGMDWWGWVMEEVSGFPSLGRVYLASPGRD